MLTFHQHLSLLSYTTTYTTTTTGELHSACERDFTKGQSGAMRPNYIHDVFRLRSYTVTSRYARTHTHTYAYYMIGCLRSKDTINNAC